MRNVTIREFQAKASQFLSDLPILLVRNGMPVAKVVAVSYEIKDITQDVYNDVNKVSTEVEVLVSKDEPCGVPGCKEPAVGLGKVWDEVSGEMEEVKMCKGHLFKSLKEAR